VEEFGLFYEQFGLPRTAGRILAWLMICDPPHQTMHELVDALQVSKSSISTASRMLMQGGIIERISLPGQRRDFYRVKQNAWVTNWETRAQTVTMTMDLVQRGLNLLADESPEQRVRLEEMLDFFAFLQAEFPQILQKYKEQRQKL
jgi:DNA-binding transcriptional regulator GbsR (MarR family)